jgi:hypothetical protein
MILSCLLDLGTTERTPKLTRKRTWAVKHCTAYRVPGSTILLDRLSTWYGNFLSACGQTDCPTYPSFVALLMHIAPFIAGWILGNQF